MNATEGFVPYFRLYGMMGCQHCLEAEQYLRSRHVPYLLVIINDDPIAVAGIEAKTGSGVAPVMVVTFNREIIKGYNADEYERVVKLYHQLAAAGAFANGTSAPGVSGGGQQRIEDAARPAQSSSNPTGAA